MRVLVTGACGFVGPYVVHTLLGKGHQVFAAVKSKCDEQLKGAGILDLDVLKPSSLVDALTNVNPEGIIHLAAQSMVKTAWDNAANTISVNTVGTANLIEAVAEICPNTFVISVGSGEEYGITAKLGHPLRETDPCFPQNPYAISKLAAGMTAIQLAKKNGMNVIHIRAFNHFGPGQAEGYVVSDFASQIARIEKYGLDPVIRVGDLSAQRDFTDVRDVVRAYVLLLEAKVDSGYVNVCSGIPQRIDYLLDCLVAKAKLPVKIKIDQQKLRPSEVPVFIGSSEKLVEATGWSLKYKFEDSLSDTLNWWRKMV